MACRETHYGCCPDGETAANGPNALGCPGLCISSIYLIIFLRSKFCLLEERKMYWAVNDSDISSRAASDNMGGSTF